jgi:hypothetical protein
MRACGFAGYAARDGPVNALAWLSWTGALVKRGSVVGRETDHGHLRPTLLPDVVEPLEPPAGSRPDSLVRSERDLAPQDFRVLVVHLDESCAGLVACSDQGADERCMLDHRPNRHLAARLQVDPDPDREPGVAFE